MWQAHAGVVVWERTNDITFDVHVGFRKRKNYIYHCLKTHAYTCAFTPLTLTNSLLLNAIQVTGFQWIANAWRQWNKTLFYYFIMLVLRSMLLSILRFIRILVADFFSLFPDLFALLHCGFSHFRNGTFSANWIEFHFKINALILWDDKKMNWTLVWCILYTFACIIRTYKVLADWLAGWLAFPDEGLLFHIWKLTIDIYFPIQSRLYISNVSACTSSLCASVSWEVAEVPCRTKTPATTIARYGWFDSYHFHLFQ